MEFFSQEASATLVDAQRQLHCKALCRLLPQELSRLPWYLSLSYNAAERRTPGRPSPEAGQRRAGTLSQPRGHHFSEAPSPLRYLLLPCSAVAQSRTVLLSSNFSFNSC